MTRRKWKQYQKSGHVSLSTPAGRPIVCGPIVNEHPGSGGHIELSAPSVLPKKAKTVNIPSLGRCRLCAMYLHSKNQVLFTKFAHWLTVAWFIAHFTHIHYCPVSISFPIIKIWLLWDCVVVQMGILILVRQCLYTEMALRVTSFSLA